MANVGQTPALSNQQRNMAFLGCLLLAISMSAFGLSLANIQGAVLDSMNGAGSFSLVTALGSAALCIMTPVGGSLMDLIGTKKVVLYFGVIVCAAAVLLAFTSNLFLYILLCVCLSGAQGAFASVPFIIVRKLFAPEKLPTYTGYLSGALAAGSFIGSWLAGWLLDHSMVGLASCFPAIFLTVGIFLILKFGPEDVLNRSKKIDILGVILLAITLLSLVFGLNYGPIKGWTSPMVLICLAGLVIGLIVLIWWEGKTPNPLIPLKLFHNKAYVLLIVVSGLLVVYMTAINTYIPQALQKLMGQSAAISGTVQIPRTIVSIILPGIAGAWVAKSTNNFWKALAAAAVVLIISCSLLVFIGPNMPLWFVITMVAITGAADSFRTVSTVPAAQSLLKMQDMGIGTSMVGFIISLSGVLASALYSIAYNTLVQATPGQRGLIEGIDTVLLISAAAALIALLLDVLVFRVIYPKALAKAKAENK